MSNPAIHVTADNPSFYPIVNAIKTYPVGRFPTGKKRDQLNHKRKEVFAVVLSQVLLRHGLTIEAVDYVYYARESKSCVVVLFPQSNIRGYTPVTVGDAE